MKFMEWLRQLGGSRGTSREVSVRELCGAVQEYRIRELAFWSCVNLIANALGRCDFRTYRNGDEVTGAEHYMWNVSPNLYQNSSVFLHKLVASLYQDNEALIVFAGAQNGAECMHVADDWQTQETQVLRQREYESVRVDDLTFNRIFAENEVLHLTLNHCNIQPVINGVYQSYVRLINAAMNAYAWENGQHWKVHVDQIAEGQDGWAETFAKMIQDQIKPFLQSDSAVLPELDGYKYESIGGSGRISSSANSGAVRAMIDDIFDFTADAFLIPPVLLHGKVEGTADAMNRFLSACIDPLTDQIAEEVNRKLYGYNLWKNGTCMRIDTSGINHIDLMDNAGNVASLLGSGFSFNEIQRALGRPEIKDEWADVHYITKNFAQAEEIAKGAST